jgi:PAS domain S-box-containing protein
MLLLMTVAAYAVAMHVGFLFRDSVSNIAMVWPAAGVGVAALISAPTGMFGGMLAALAVTNLVNNWLIGNSLSFSAVLTTANLVEMSIIALLARRQGAPTRFCDDVPTLLRVFLGPLLLGCIAGAAIGGRAASTVSGAPLIHEFALWFSADAVAVVVLTPCILFWAQAVRAETLLPTRGELLRFFAVFFVIALWMAVAEWLRPMGLHRPYVLFPLMFWCAIYTPPRYMTLLMATLGAVTVYAVVYGTFGTSISYTTSRLQMLREAQAFLSVLAMSALLAVALAHNKQRSDVLLRQSHTNLEHTVARRTQQLLEANDLLHSEIKAREEFARRLAESEAQTRLKLAELETIYRTANIGLCLIDEELRYVRINESLAALQGHTPEAHIGKSIRELYPYLPESVPRLLQQVVATGEALHDVEVESPLLTPSGASRKFLVSYYPVETTRGRCVGCIVREITDRIEMERELERHRSDLAHVARMNLLGSLATGLAHELNQPLHAIANYAQGCLRRLLQEPPQAQELAKVASAINQESHRAAEIVRRLRDMAKKQPPRIEPVDVGQVVQHSIRLLSPEFKVHKTKLTVELPPVLPALRGDAIQLEQVLLNLALNAIEATKHNDAHDRHVALAVRADSLELKLSVSDNGPGIRDIADKLFEPFFSTREDGLGMGLSISRDIVERHGGRLFVEENTPRGAIFTVSLPVAA